jgi:hypothetical protein
LKILQSHAGLFAQLGDLMAHRTATVMFMKPVPILVDAIKFNRFEVMPNDDAKAFISTKHQTAFQSDPVAGLQLISAHGFILMR